MLLLLLLLGLICISGHNHHSHSHGLTADEEYANAFKHQHMHLKSESNRARFNAAIWGEALFATALVGLCPIVLLFFVPLGKRELDQQKNALRVFLSFAAGGLLGDAFLHLLPHSMPQAHGHHHSLEDLSPWLWTVCGIVAFLVLEKIVRSKTGQCHHKKQEDGKDTQIAAAGYLNLAADFSHNFTDGLAIGATFLQGSGWQTTLAMLIHEVPHEIGDFAILLQSGFSRRDAMWSQVSTAIGAMIGTVVGLLMEGVGSEKAAWITPFTAGGFIYIACTSVIPEILQDGTSLRQSIMEIAALAAGVFLMVLIALYE